MEKDRLSERYTLRDFDVDWNHCLTAGAFLRLAQQLATEHCGLLGMDQKFYEDNQAVFLLAKAAVHFERIPMLGETLTLTTLPETPHRAVYKRILRAQDEEGRTVGLADSRWVLVDTNTRHILRHPPRAFETLPFVETVDDELEFALPVPEQLESCGSLHAAYSLCDQNMHLNNTRYVDAAADCLPMELMKTQAVSDLVIRYHNELPAGETALLERGQTENGWYLKGSREGHSCFEAALRLRKV